MRVVTASSDATARSAALPRTMQSILVVALRHRPIYDDDQDDHNNVLERW